MNIFSFFERKRNATIKPNVLLIYDGWGIAPQSEGNAISRANVPNFNYYWTNYPHSALIASGESVGLPANEVGNSEVGHLTIGAGRVIFESLVRINRSIDDASFSDNEAFVKCIKHTQEYKSKLHLVGMASYGNVHSSLKHLYALIDFAGRSNVTTVLHLFTDGRDAAPNEGLNVIKEVEAKLTQYANIKIGSICGRYYGMDRDGRWDRTGLSYKNMVLGDGPKEVLATTAIQNSYNKAVTDEFIPPTLIVDGDTPQDKIISDNDSVVFFNFRVDRARQLAMSFVIPDFENLHEYEWGFDLDQGNKSVKKADGPTFTRQKILKNLFSVTMTEYQKQLPVSAVAFPTPLVVNSLGEVISAQGFKQFHLAESEKERMVTYYFDGFRTERFSGEEVTIVASPKVPTYDKKPEMSVQGLVSKLREALSKDTYHFIVLNIANPDMVAHTGNLEATVKALEYVDKATGEIVKEVFKSGGTVYVTADHGNAEELITYNQSNFFFTSDEGSMNTEHSNNPVPFIIINEKLLGQTGKLRNGALSDVATTVLSLMGIKVPEEMTGENLFGGAETK